jgi:hypothetical protein
MKPLPVTAAIAVVFTTACTDYAPILDGPESETYQSDVAACQSLAASQKRFNQDALGAAVAGGLLGVAVANHDGSATTVEGLIGGALIAYVMAQGDAVEEKEDIVVACMQGRGHRVVG